jgi:hypothetical protein
MRWEPTGTESALLHLCAERAIGPVRSWSVTAGAVERITDRTALAVVPLDPARRVTVTVIPAGGPPLTFAAAPSGTAGSRP